MLTLALLTAVVLVAAAAGGKKQSVSKICVFNNAGFVLQWHLQDTNTGSTSADTMPYDVGHAYCLSGRAIGNISAGSAIVPVVQAIAGQKITASESVTYDSVSGGQVTYVCLGTTLDFSCRAGPVTAEVTRAEARTQVRHLRREEALTRAKMRKEKAITRALVSKLTKQLDQSQRNVRHANERMRNIDKRLQDMDAILIVGCICLFMLLGVFAWFLFGARRVRSPTTVSEPLLQSTSTTRLGQTRQQPAFTVSRESVEWFSVACWAIGGWLLACWSVGGWQLVLAVGGWLLFVGGLAVGGWLVLHLASCFWLWAVGDCSMRT